MYGGSGVGVASYVAGAVDSEGLTVIAAGQHADDLQAGTAGGHEGARVATLWGARTPDELAAEIDLVHDDASACEWSDFRYSVVLGRCRFPCQSKRQQGTDFANHERHSLGPLRAVSFDQ